MHRFFILLIASLSSVLLAGCSVFYPNWGATGLPEEVDLSSVSESVTPEPTSTETQSTEPSPEATDSEPSTKKLPAEVIILMAVAEPDFGVLTVVAQVPNLSESGGACTFRFLGNNVEKSLQVRSEPSSDYTQCFPIEFPLADLPKGNAVVTVTYESDRHQGVSAATSVVIP